MKNLSQYTMYVLLLIGALTFVLSLMGNYNAMIYYAYALCGVTVVVTLMTSVGTVLANPTKLKGSLIGIGVLALVFIVSYMLASDSLSPTYGDGVSATTSRLTGMGLYSFYILFIGAIGSIVFSGISKILK